MNDQLIVAVLAGVSTVSLGGAVLAARSLRRAPLQMRLRSLRGEVIDPEEAIGTGAGVADLMGGLGKLVSSGPVKSNLREELTQAGYHSRAAAPIYLGTKAMLFVIGLLVGAIAVVPTSLESTTKAIVVMGGGMILFLLPNVFIFALRASRRREVREHLPDAIDLLEICVSAGMGLDMAWNAVADEVREVSTILSDEMALTTLEMHLGGGRAEAMRAMARRTGADELSSLVAVLVQSERFGTSIIDSLRNFASSMRENRSMRAQEAAEKMAVKLIFPMVLFIFPAVVLVMAGPAGLSLYRVLGD